MTYATKAPYAAEISMGRAEALVKGQHLARFFEEHLHSAGYRGPVAVAGGYLRDIALSRTPKDLDLFLDGGHIEGIPGVEKLAAYLSNHFHGATLGRSIPCYGEWAEDVAVVGCVKMDLDNPPPSLDWPAEFTLPVSIDLVVLLRDALRNAGYVARMVNDAYNQEMFLKSVCARVDIRLNSLGATPACTFASPHWDHDAYQSRLVIQHSRKEGTPRIEKRLSRLISGKYASWGIFSENEDGSVTPRPIEESTPTASNTSGGSFIESWGK